MSLGREGVRLSETLAVGGMDPCVLPWPGDIGERDALQGVVLGARMRLLVGKVRLECFRKSVERFSEKKHGQTRS
jgi:hypothetical protein